MERNKIKKFKNFILDVDGVLTTGQFCYSEKGKVLKTFGPDDSDALSLLKDKIYIHIISGDKRGFKITKKRISEDMKYPLDLVSTFERLDWIKSKGFVLDETIFMGDGIYDALVFPYVAYSIAPANAFYKTKELADFVTASRGGEGAVAEACVHIVEELFGEKFDVFKQELKNGSGAWKKNKKR
ncbi:MAG: HAD hydrolase family protein [Candidatus Portnoybacteria bacterium]|nr:HAD hydrolase family protein [Candidatus Portnoybacteria bacterium]